MSDIIITLALISLMIFSLMFIIMIILALLKKYKFCDVSFRILFVNAIISLLLLSVALPISLYIETERISTPEITVEEKEFFYISKTGDTDVDLGMFSLIIFGEIDGTLTFNNDFLVFYRTEGNEISEERIEAENLKFIIVENAEDEKIVTETHTYYEQLNYRTPPEVEVDYFETHYKLYVTEKTFKEIFK